VLLLALGLTPALAQQAAKISARKMGADHQEGINSYAEDGLDAIACDKCAFHIVPQAFTLILLSTGLVGLRGYYGLRRKRSSTDE